MKVILYMDKYEKIYTRCIYHVTFVVSKEKVQYALDNNFYIDKGDCVFGYPSYQNLIDDFVDFFKRHHLSILQDMCTEYCYNEIETAFDHNKNFYIEEKIFK